MTAVFYFIFADFIRQINTMVALILNIDVLIFATMY